MVDLEPAESGLDEFAEREGLSYDFITPGFTLLDILDADVSGRDFEQGKPHPMIFLAAAEELNLQPEECFVIEDATNGIQAAKAGEFQALGISRADDAEARAASEVYIELPKVSTPLQPLVSIIPLQLFACELATVKGHDVDQPRNLAKSVTVE